MKITKVDVRKYEKENSKMRGIASVTLDGCFVVKGIRIIEGDNGLFIAMPSRDKYTDDGVVHEDVAHPVNQETRDMFTEAVLEAYSSLE